MKKVLVLLMFTMLLICFFLGCEVGQSDTLS